MHLTQEFATYTIDGSKSGLVYILQHVNIAI